MRVLIISDAWEPQVNGVVRTYQSIIHELSAMGHVVRVIGPHEFDWTIPMPGYAEIRLVLRPRRRLFEKMDDFHPDALHIATEGPLGFAARAWAKNRNFPFTTAYHTDFPQYIHARLRKFSSSFAEWWRKRTIKVLRRFHNTSACIMVSTAGLQETLAGQGFTAPMGIMTRGVDTSIFRPDGPKAILPKGFETAGPIALYVGRIATEKNLDAFLDMPWDGQKVVVGDGPLRPAFKQKYPHVFFAGLQTGHDLASYYRMADVFVFPSRTDTFGIVLIEAMACGLPIAAYPVQGPIDIITSPHLGVLDSDLAHASRAALSCGSADQRAIHANTHYTWRKAAEQFTEHHMFKTGQPS